MFGERYSSQGIQSKVCLFNHQGLFHISGNQDTNCLHISACDPNTSLSNTSSFCLLDSLVAGGAWGSPCQRQHQDVTRYREECGRVNSEPAQQGRRGSDPLLSASTQKWPERDRKEFSLMESCPSSPLHTQPSKGERKGCVGSRGTQSLPKQGVQCLRQWHAQHNCCYLLCCQAH